MGKLLSPEELSYSAQTTSKIHVLLVSKHLKVRPEINLKTVTEQREKTKTTFLSLFFMYSQAVFTSSSLHHVSGH